MNEPIGYLVEGWFTCPNCAALANEKSPVYTENIGQYRQTCAKCKRVVIEGQPGWPELFNTSDKLESEA